MITVEKHQVVYDPEDGRPAKIWGNRKTFPFVNEIAKVQMASIEHDRKLYHLVYNSAPSNVVVVNSPDELDMNGKLIAPELDFLDKNIKAIESAAYPKPTLSDVKIEKKRKLLEDFNNSFVAGYITSNGITMDAFHQDLIMLDSGYQLATRSGAKTLIIRDFNNVNHVLPLADVDTMIIELGQNWQTQLQRLWAAKDKINKARTKTSIDKIIL